MKVIHFKSADTSHQNVVIEKVAQTPFSKEICISMAKGGVMREHTAPRPITIMVLNGVVEIASGVESDVLYTGDMVVFEAHVAHSLEAIESSVIRLSLSNEDKFERVMSVLKKP